MDLQGSIHDNLGYIRSHPVRVWQSEAVYSYRLPNGLRFERAV
jgi:hypothetical protein